MVFIAKIILLNWQIIWSQIGIWYQKNAHKLLKCPPNHIVWRKPWFLGQTNINKNKYALSVLYTENVIYKLDIN